MTEILDTCRIWRDIGKHPLPSGGWIDIKLSCGSILMNAMSYGDSAKWMTPVSYDIPIPANFITQWRPSK